MIHPRSQRGVTLIEMLIVIAVVLTALALMVSRFDRVQVDTRALRGAELLTAGAHLLSQRWPDGYATYSATDAWQILPVELRGTTSPLLSGFEFGERATLAIAPVQIIQNPNEALRFTVSFLNAAECAILANQVARNADRLDINGVRVLNARGEALAPSVIVSRCALATPASVAAYAL